MDEILKDDLTDPAEDDPVITRATWRPIVEALFIRLGKADPEKYRLSRIREELFRTGGIREIPTELFVAADEDQERARTVVY
jgi:hypothetical protein